MVNIKFHGGYYIAELGPYFLPNLFTATLTYMGLMRPEIPASQEWPDPENFNQ